MILLKYPLAHTFDGEQAYPNMSGMSEAESCWDYPEEICAELEELHPIWTRI